MQFTSTTTSTFYHNVCRHTFCKLFIVATSRLCVSRVGITIRIIRVSAFGIITVNIRLPCFCHHWQLAAGYSHHWAPLFVCHWWWLAAGYCHHWTPCCWWLAAGAGAGDLLLVTATISLLSLCIIDSHLLLVTVIIGLLCLVVTISGVLFVTDNISFWSWFPSLSSALLSPQQSHSSC